MSSLSHRTKPVTSDDWLLVSEEPSPSLGHPKTLRSTEPSRPVLEALIRLNKSKARVSGNHREDKHLPTHHKTLESDLVIGPASLPTPMLGHRREDEELSRSVRPCDH